MSTAEPTRGCSRPCASAARSSAREGRPRPIPEWWTPGRSPLDAADAEWIHANRLNGTITAAEAVAYRRNCSTGSPRCRPRTAWSCSCIRASSATTTSRRWQGTDRIPDTTCRMSPPSRAPLQPLLRDFGTHPNLHLVLFTVDETAFSREIAPLAGFYPSVYAGAPWWFLDSPAGIARYRAAVTDSAGFAKTSGFIDDTRALLLDPGPARRLPASRRRVPRDPRRDAPARRGRGRRDRGRTRLRDPHARLQARTVRLGRLTRHGLHDARRGQHDLVDERDEERASHRFAQDEQPGTTSSMG
ncbi:MAG: hypothetical protein WDM88_05840 [Galbitalea sp.]